jgi:hypothetical protein
MPAYMVTYDLRRADSVDYNVLIQKLKESRAVRVTESAWHVATTWTAVQVREFLKQFMHQDDVLSVDEMAFNTNHASSNLPKPTIAWRAAHLIPRRPAVK